MEAVKDEWVRDINRRCMREILPQLGATEAEIDEACAISDEMPESIVIRAAVVYTELKRRHGIIDCGFRKVGICNECEE